MVPELPRIVMAVMLALLVSLRGLRKKSLSPGGSLSAFFVGFISLATSYRFGATLFMFYLSATRATRYKASVKKKLEDGFTSSTGNRSAKQVLASSLPAILTALLYLYLYRYDAPILPTFKLRSSLNLAYLLFFSACAGDTFASEIGIAMPGPGKLPVLVLKPWVRVPRGTNGGVTLEGSLASAFGGLLTGSAHFLAGPEWTFSQLWLLNVGLIGGVLGSWFDSVLGMFLQASWLDMKTDRVLKESPSPEMKEKGGVKHICGMDILSGETVNMMAAVITSCLAPLFLSMFQVSYPEL